MTKDERNAEICRQFREGDTQLALAQRYKLSKSRVAQITKKAGLQRQHRKRVAAPRSAFIGCFVTEAVRDAVDVARKGKPTSQYVSDLLESKVARKKVS